MKSVDHQRFNRKRIEIPKQDATSQGSGSPLSWRRKSRIEESHNLPPAIKNSNVFSYKTSEKGTKVYKRGDTSPLPSQQPTASSDFMNRFKGKVTQMNKAGHHGVAEDTKQPIKKLEFIGF